MKKLQLKINFLFIALLALTLQSCFFVAGAAAGAAAVAIVYDQRNVESILQDQKIAREVLHRIQDDTELRDNTHINVTSFGQVVLLTGEAPDAELRKQAEEVARTVRGIKRIYNAIIIQGPTSSLSHASDAWITTKIKTEMLATKGLKSASIKVVTENGTVYLMGTVTREQEDIILNIVKHTHGVEKVVKIFQLHEKAPQQKQPQATANVTENTVSEGAVPQSTEEMKPIIAE